MGASTLPFGGSVDRLDGSGPFLARMAWACAAIAVLGFLPTYWAPLALGSVAASPVVHFHGLSATAWVLLFAAQATLASQGRFEGHRALGLAGIAIATTMILSGWLAVVGSLEAGIERGFEEQARAFSIVPFTLMLFFAIVVAAAVANARKPEVHFRLMLVATAAVLAPAIARWFILGAAAARGVPADLLAPPPMMVTLVPALVTDLLIAAAIVHDIRKRGRPHPAYLVAGGALLLLQVARVPASGSAAWHAVTDWLLRFA
jgi:hypothetical protein